MQWNKLHKRGTYHWVPSMLGTVGNENICWAMKLIGRVACWPVTLSSCYHGGPCTCQVQWELYTQGRDAGLKTIPSPDWIPRKPGDPRDKGIAAQPTTLFFIWGWEREAGLHGPYKRYTGCPLESQGDSRHHPAQPFHCEDELGSQVQSREVT